MIAIGMQPKGRRLNTSVAAESMGIRGYCGTLGK